MFVVLLLDNHTPFFVESDVYSPLYRFLQLLGVQRNRCALLLRKTKTYYESGRHMTVFTR